MNTQTCQIIQYSMNTQTPQTVQYNEHSNTPNHTIQWTLKHSKSYNTMNLQPTFFSYLSIMYYVKRVLTSCSSLCYESKLVFVMLYER